MKYRDVDVELTKEQEDALRRFLPISKEREFSHTPDAMMVLPDGKRPVFLLRELNGVEALDLQEAARRAIKDGEPLANGAYAKAVVEHGLVGWNNFYALDGAEIPFDKDKVCDTLGTLLLLDLMAAILNRGRLSAEERLGLR